MSSDSRLSRFNLFNSSSRKPAHSPPTAPLCAEYTYATRSKRATKCLDETAASPKRTRQASRGQARRVVADDSDGGAPEQPPRRPSPEAEDAHGEIGRLMHRHRGLVKEYSECEARLHSLSREIQGIAGKLEECIGKMSDRGRRSPEPAENKRPVAEAATPQRAAARGVAEPRKAKAQGAHPGESGSRGVGALDLGPRIQPAPARKQQAVWPQFETAKQQTTMFGFRLDRDVVFEKKPRGAVVCSFQHMGSPAVVAYGLDGRVQVIDGRTKRRLSVVDMKSALGVDFAEHLAQVSPTMLATVPGFHKSEGAKAAGNPSTSVGVLYRSPRPSDSRALLNGSQALGGRSPHGLGVTVVAGTMAPLGRHSPPDMQQSANTDSFDVMLTGGKDKKACLWKLETDRSTGAVSVLETYEMRVSHTQPICALAWDNTRSNALVGGGEGKISIYDVERQRVLAEGRVKSEGVNSLLVNPRFPGCFMANYTAGKNQVKIFDLRCKSEALAPVLMLTSRSERRKSKYTKAAWHPDGYIVACPTPGNSGSAIPGDEGQVSFWDTRFQMCRFNEPQTHSPHKLAVWSVDFLPSIEGESVMVTTGGDWELGYTSFRV